MDEIVHDGHYGFLAEKLSSAFAIQKKELTWIQHTG